MGSSSSRERVSHLERVQRRAQREYEARGSGASAVARPIQVGAVSTMRSRTRLTMQPPPLFPNAHLPPPHVAATLEALLNKEAILLIFALRWFICLSSTDIISTLNQYYAASPERRPQVLPGILEPGFIVDLYHSLEGIVQFPFTVEMKYYVECMTNLRWRRLAADVYRAHRPENEEGPLPTTLVQREDREVVADYSQSQEVDMDEVDESEGSQLCIALRTWIGE